MMIMNYTVRTLRRYKDKKKCTNKSALIQKFLYNYLFERGAAAQSILIRVELVPGLELPDRTL